MSASQLAGYSTGWGLGKLGWQTLPAVCDTVLQASSTVVQRSITTRIDASSTPHAKALTVFDCVRAESCKSPSVAQRPAAVIAWTLP
eukprot:scaffold58454_cov31-Tisochrysis_lutea.AAC.4